MRVEHWEPGTSAIIDAGGGAELFVLEGAFEESGEQFHQHSWLRLPTSRQATTKSGAQGARVWIKSGHLPFASAPRSG